MKKQPLQIYTAKHSAIKYEGVVWFINPLLTDMEEDKEDSDCTVPSEADAVVLRLALDEKEKSFEDVEELQFNPSVINEGLSRDCNMGVSLVCNLFCRF